MSVIVRNSCRYVLVGLDADLQNQRQRHGAVQFARKEFSRISNRLRIQHALRSDVPSSANKIFEVGGLVRVHYDELKGYTEPVSMLSIDEGSRMVSAKCNGKRNFVLNTIRGTRKRV